MTDFIVDNILFQEAEENRDVNAEQVEAIAQGYRMMRDDPDFKEAYDDIFTQGELACPTAGPIAPAAGGRGMKGGATEEEKAKAKAKRTQIFETKLNRLISNLFALATYMRNNDVVISTRAGDKDAAKLKVRDFIKYAYPGAEFKRDRAGDEAEVLEGAMPGKAVRLPPVEAAKKRAEEISNSALDTVRIFFPVRTRFLEEINKDPVAADQFLKEINDLIYKYKTLDEKKGQAVTALAQVAATLSNDPIALREVSNRILKSLAYDRKNDILVALEQAIAEATTNQQKGGAPKSFFVNYLESKIGTQAEPIIRSVLQKESEKSKGELNQAFAEEMGKLVGVFQKMLPAQDGSSQTGGYNDERSDEPTEEDQDSIPEDEKDTATVAKENRERLDAAKKTARAIVESLTTIQNRYDKFHEKQKAATTVIDEYQGKSTGKPAGEQPQKSELTDKERKEKENEIIRYNTYFKDEGEALVRDASERFTSITRSLKGIQEDLQRVVGADAEQANKRLKEAGQRAKALFEEDDGILFLIGRMTEDIKDEHRDIYAQTRSLADSIEKEQQRAYELKKLELQPRNPNKNGETLGGAGDEDTNGKVPEIVTDGKPKKEDIDTKKNIEKAITKVKDDLMARISEIEKAYTNITDPVAASFATDENIFTKIYNQFLEKKADKSKSLYLAEEELAAGLKANGLIPRDVLRVNAFDKVIFIFVTLFIRLFSINITQYLIERGYLVSLMTVLAVYVGIFLLFLIAFVMLVNLDRYRMRILFNYVNFNANSSKVYGYVGAFLFVSAIIYFIIWNMDIPIVGSIRVKAITEEEKIRLRYRMEIVTLIQWLLVTLIVILS